MATLQTPSFSRFMQKSSGHEMPCNVPIDEKDRDLKEQLERERDKNLCVVCQTDEKNIVVIPCRHMCMCKGCSCFVRKDITEKLVHRAVRLSLQLWKFTHKTQDYTASMR